MKAGARLTVVVVVAAIAGLLLGSALLGAESPEVDEPGRYQTANFSSIGVSVLDTHTGAVYSYKFSGEKGPWRVLAPPLPQ
jgi:hypothetical protein